MSESLAQCNYRNIIDPTSAENASRGFYPGAHWLNTNTNELFKCTASDNSSATWMALASVDLSGLLPLSGGTMTGTLDLGNQNIANGGEITAASFVGDGSALTGITAPNDTSKLPLAGGTMTGTLDMGSGSITGVMDLQTAAFEANHITVSGDGGYIHMTGCVLAMNDNSGSLGGDINMDGGNINDALGITLAGNLTFANGGNSASINLFTDGILNVGGLHITNDVSVNGHTVRMNDGSGTGGGSLNMDNGTITNATDVETAALGANHITLWGDSPYIHVSGGSFAMNDASGVSGGNILMDGGSIFNCANIYTDTGGAPYATQSWVTSQGYYVGSSPTISTVLGAGNDAGGFATITGLGGITMSNSSSDINLNSANLVNVGGIGNGGSPVAMLSGITGLTAGQVGISNGLTGSGNYTSFTFENGICTAAS